MKTRYKIALSALCFCTLNYGCKTLNGDFDLQSLIAPLPQGTLKNYPKEQDTSSLSSLDRPFRYLSKGTQAFVFSSEDGEYVLKVFKPFYPPFKLWGMKFHPALVPGMKLVFNKLCSERIAKALLEDFDSYVIATHVFKEESLIEHLHLEKTSHLKKKIVLFDKLGIRHEIDADNSCFFLQKKTDLLQTQLKKFVKEGRMGEAKELLTNLLLLLKKRDELRFVKPTDKFRANFGCIGTTPIQIDIGKLTLTEEGPHPRTLDNSLFKLNEWLEKQIPSLLPMVEEVRVSLDMPEPARTL